MNKQNVNKELGVLTEYDFYNAALESFPIDTPIKNIADLAAQALAHDLTYVWVLPGCFALGGVDFCTPGPEWDSYTNYDLSGNPVCCRIWRRGTPGRAGRTVYIQWPDHGPWEWDIPDHITLLATVSYLEKVIGMPVVWSPGHLGIKILKDMNSKGQRANWLAQLPGDIHGLTLGSGRPFDYQTAARDIVWKRPLLQVEKGMYLHKLDKNSAHPAACTGQALGAGMPTHCYATDYDSKKPGLWKVVKAEIGENAYHWNGTALPNPIRSIMTTTSIEQARRQGYTIEVGEGYQWEESHRILDTWARFLWECRQALKAPSAEYKHDIARLNARQTCNDILHVTIGKLADRKTRDHWYYRPDWWTLIVARATSAMFYNISQLLETATLPALVYIDALWIPSIHADPAAACPQLLKREGELGGFKVVYDKPLVIDETIIDAFNQSDSIVSLVQFLNELAGEE